MVRSLRSDGVICYRCGKQRLDHTTPPMPLCECDDGPRGSKRIRMGLSRGGTMDVNVSPDVTPETLDALKRVGEAALDRTLAEEDAESS